jgi:hypothetical protein
MSSERGEVDSDHWDWDLGERKRGLAWDSVKG